MRAAWFMAIAALAAVAGCVLLTDLDGLTGGAPSDGGVDGDSNAPTDAPAGDVVASDAGDAGDLSSYTKEVLADAPVVYLKLGEATGTIAKDQLAKYDGEYGGSFMLAQPGLIAGDTDKALQLNGEGWVSLPVIPGLFIGKTPFTIEAWMKVEFFEATQWIVGREDVEAPRYGVSLIFGMGSIALERWQDGGASRVDGKPPRIGFPTHVVGTFDGAKMQVWVDGASGQAGSSGTNVPENSLEIGIGAQSSHLAGRFKGVVDEIALYDRALTSERILAHYRAGKAP
jgi:hypothetical protein